MCENSENAQAEAEKTYCEYGTDIPKMGKNPVVLSSKRFEKVLNNATNTDNQRIKKEAEEERKYREYLKKGNEELVAKFTGKVQRTEGEKIKQLAEQSQAKAEQARRSYQAAKDHDEILRKEKIADAKVLIEKMKPGPRQLHRAAIQSEILRARDIHKSLNEEYKKAIKLQECADKKLCEAQNENFLADAQTRVEERKKNLTNYKSELLKTINDNARLRAEAKERKIREERKERAAVDEEIQAQIERERAIMEKKRATLRQHALDAMKMVEQRRLREQMENEVEDRLCCVYNAGKRELDKMRSDQVKQLQDKRFQMVANTAKTIDGKTEQQEALENERIRRDITTKQLKFTAEEQEKVNKEKAAKKARIEAYCRQVEAAKLAKQRAEEERRFEMANRFKNAEVNCVFNESQKEDRFRRHKDVRIELEKQIKEREEAKKLEKEADASCANAQYEHDDKFFFEYANDLMQHAKQKQRPLYPFVKVVQGYKRENAINCPTKTPRHLVTNINMGTENAKCSSFWKKKSFTGRAVPSPKQKYSSAVNESILESCRKIDDLLADTVNDKNDCKPQNPVDCFKSDPCKPLKSKKEDDCPSKLPPPNKLRYSMTELKNMNQFACTTKSTQ